MYRIVYAKPTQSHIEVLAPRRQRLVFDAVDKQLQGEPTVETRNRKRMRPNPMATWKLRIGTLRVYYDVFMEPEPTVLVVAVGIKDRNALRIGGYVVEI